MELASCQNYEELCPSLHFHSWYFEAEQKSLASAQNWMVRDQLLGWGGGGGRRQKASGREAGVH